MNKEQLYLTLLAEECAEVAKLASKAIRFGLDSIDPETRLKLVWMAFIIWFLFAPTMYILLFFVGLLTLNNPHRFASDALNEMT
jgi:hypothetical protein